LLEGWSLTIRGEGKELVMFAKGQKPIKSKKKNAGYLPSGGSFLKGKQKAIMRGSSRCGEDKG